MSLTRALVLKLSQKEYNGIVGSLQKSEASKSIELIKHLRQEKLELKEIQQKLHLRNSAFYTLNSRLTERIEDYILQNSNNPRSQLVIKAAAVNDILLNQSKTVAIATLKKLEKELLAYDLNNELIQVYRALKKLTTEDSRHFEYNKLFNQQVTIMITMDKVEDNVADYFKRFTHKISNYNHDEDLSFDIIKDELANNYNIYGSHRMYVYYMLVSVFHDINAKNISQNDIEKTLYDVDKLFKNYQLDISYQHIRWIFKYLRLLYYYSIDQNHKGIVPMLQNLEQYEHRLTSNSYLFTYIGFYFNIKLSKIYSGEITYTYESINNLEQVDSAQVNLSVYVLIRTQIAIYYYLESKNEKAVELLEELCRLPKLKKHTILYIETKLLKLIISFWSGDLVKVAKGVKGIQRLMRIEGREKFTYAHYLLDFLNTVNSIDSAEAINKKQRAAALKFKECTKPMYSPLFNIDLNTER